MSYKFFIAVLFLVFNLSAQAGFIAVANISAIHGKAISIIAKNKEALKVGDEVSEGMIIKLAKKGDYIDIKFQNGHKIRMMGSEVKVERLDPKNTLFNLIKGKIFSAVHALTPNEKFEIKTKRASFAVRGTRFFIEESKKGSYLCVCEGVVNAKNAKGEVDVKKDEDIMVVAKQDLKVTPSTKNMIDMSNSVYKEMGVE